MQSPYVNEDGFPSKQEDLDRITDLERELREAKVELSRRSKQSDSMIKTMQFEGAERDNLKRQLREARRLNTRLSDEAEDYRDERDRYREALERIAVMRTDDSREPENIARRALEEK